ncbi:siderophore-interacting protein [Rhodoferax sp.]|uniref:siderophore-interacting protein n=1 Tax=Rhodoferax sp. TaxID=50421 RepID=UPI00374CA2D4
MDTSVTPTTTPNRTAERVRHELKFRLLEVVNTRHISPHMVRVTLGGADLAGFTSPGFDDHVKVFFPDPVTSELVLPSGPPGSGATQDGPRPTMRDYTPRNFDAQALTLEIDFALHDAGPATTWAAQSKIGQKLGVGGPRGSFILPIEFDGHLLIGDDTALPAIGRRLAELPAGAPALVLAEVNGPEDEQNFDTHADLSVVWVHRLGQPHGSQPLLLERLKTVTLPAGDIHAWVGCETSTAKALRTHLVGERGVNPKWTKAAGYWRQGSAASHDKIED